MPSSAAHSAVASEPAPHQMRSRRPGECGSTRRRPGGLGNIGRGFGLAKPSPFSSVEEHLGVRDGPCRRRSGPRPARSRSSRQPSMTCSGEPRLMPELEPAAGDQVGRAGVLGHVQRVLVPHVDDAGADLDPARLRADRRQQRERRRQLAGEVVHAEVGAVGSDLLCGDREVDGLQQDVRRGAGLRARRRRPVAEGEEADLLHTLGNTGDRPTFRRPPPRRRTDAPATALMRETDQGRPKAEKLCGHEGRGGRPLALGRVARPKRLRPRGAGRRDVRQPNARWPSRASPVAGVS